MREDSDRRRRPWHSASAPESCSMRRHAFEGMKAYTTEDGTYRCYSDRI